MRSWFRFGVAALLALVATGPLPAQFIFQREYFGRPGLLRGPGPFLHRHSTPILVRQVRQEQQSRPDEEGYRGAAAAALGSNIEITANVAGDAARNDAIKRAIADTRRWLEEAPVEAGSLRVAVGGTIALRVSEDPDHPLAKADLSDVLPRHHVVWNYPPANLFEVVHEDSTRAVLVLTAKAAGTHTVSAAVLMGPAPEPIPAPAVKKADPKDAKNKKEGEENKAAADERPKQALPFALTRKNIRFVNFTIQVGDAPVQPAVVTPPVTPPVIAPPASLEAALQTVKAAYAEERGAKGISTLKLRLDLFAKVPNSSEQTLQQHLRALRNVNPSSRTLAAIEHALKAAPLPASVADLTARVALIAQQLK